MRAAELGGKWTNIVSGSGFACATDPQTYVYCWGSGSHGQLGLGTIHAVTPQRLTDLPRTRVLTAGAHHACATTATVPMQSYCWGSGKFGKLGNGKVDDVNRPSVVSGAFSHLSAGEDHTCGINDSGSLYCWGANSSAQLGMGSADRADHPTPRQVGILSWNTVSAGTVSTCGLVGVQAYCWGSGAFGALGINDLHEQAVPMPIKGREFRSIYTKGSTACAISIERKLFCWGANSFGQVGDGTTVDRRVPVPVEPKSSFLSVLVGHQHACAITTDELLVCWGNNQSAQVGLGFMPGVYTYPMSVRHSCVSVAPGHGSTYALCRESTPAPLQPRPQPPTWPTSRCGIA